MLREGARCEVLPDILGRANIDVTQNIFTRAGGTNEWMRDMVGGRKTLTVAIARLDPCPKVGRYSVSVTAWLRQLASKLKEGGPNRYPRCALVGAPFSL
jgi:hypothetical protein